MIAPPNCIAAIDVSAAQGTIDGARIAAAGIALAWVEIGVGNDRQRIAGKRLFRENIEQMIGAADHAAPASGGAAAIC